MFSLRWRLMVAFAGLAVVAVGLVAGLAAVSTTSQFTRLDQQQRARTAQQVAEAVAAAYRQAGGWDKADLRTARALASSAGAELAVVKFAAPSAVEWTIPEIGDPAGDAAQSAEPRSDPTGQASPHHGSSSSPMDDGHGMHEGPTSKPSAAHASASPPLSASASASTTTAPGHAPTRSAGKGEEAAITVDGHPVGAVVLSFPPAALTSSAQGIARSAILDQLLVAVALALLVSVVLSLLVSRRIARPIRQLAAATRAVEQGDRSIAVPEHAPGEIGQLARTFNRMTGGLARAEDARRAIVADVAHELRTPVTVMRGTLEALVDGVTEPSRELFGSLQDEALKLGRILDDLAALAAADSAVLHLNRESVDLSAVVGQNLELFAAVAQESDVRLRASTLEQVVVEGDAARLSQVVANLLGNGLKFTPAGGMVTVEVRRAGAYGQVSVSDTGPGIDADEAPHVFDRFWRGAAGHGVSGSGVGLAVVKELVEAHGGSVSVESRPGEGATFIVRVPVGKERPTAPAAA